MPLDKDKNKNKNKNNKKNQQDFESFSMPFDIQQYSDSIIKKSIDLGKKLIDFKQRRNDWRYSSNQDLETFTQWLPYFQQAYDIDLLKGELDFIQLTYKSAISAAPSIDHFFKSYNFFNGTTWPARISNRIVGKFQNFPGELKKYLVGLMSKLLDGYVFGEPLTTLSVPDTPAYTKFFYTQIKNSSRCLLWMIGVERVPKLTSNKLTVQRFEYVHYMKFLDVVTMKEINKGHHLMSCTRVIYDNRKDPARQDFGHLQSSYNRAALFQETDTFTGTATEFIEFGVPHAKYSPNKFKSITLSDREKSSIMYDARNGRWKTGEQSRMLDYDQYNTYMDKLNRDTIRDKANFKNASQIVEFLKKIPNFRIKLTPEQNAVVGQAENVVALGRSGTGKTTCAILRLFAMEILFKFRMTLARLKNEGLAKASNFTHEDLDNVFGLHCIFVTASPVLSNEVQRYYNRLTGQVKEELKNKQKRILEKKKAEEEKRREEEKLKKVQEQSEVPDQDNKEGEINMEEKEQQLRNEAIEALELAEEGIKEINIEEPEFDNDEDLIDEEEADNQIMRNMEKLNSLRHVRPETFPLFLTVKRLVLLIDGCLTRPFFARNVKDQIIGLDSNAQWHNEMKGVMMIGNYHKKVRDFDKTVKQAEEDKESDIGSSDSDNSEDELEEEEFMAEYRRELNNRAKASKKENNRKIGSNSYRMSFEVEYEYFEGYFWYPIIMKRFPYIDIHPLVVWSEIQSNIKGSANSHLYPGSYLPERVYYGKDSQKKNFLTKEKKTIIYDIFGRYERWKRDIAAYDFMDVVNYALAQIRFYGYNGAPIHYLMIDEVQDLTHATILLFMRTTTMGLFFSGDTAQTIAKGVGMRFSDLKSLFKIKEEMYYNSYYKSTWKEPVVKQLTVNFRSHGKILELANSVVTVIETFFPKTIDKLRKEKSEIDGPKPILLADVSLDALFSLLFGTENYKSERHSDNKGSITSNQIEFGCNQVIIVRDQESKDKLPPLLKHALVLTVYEAKGLEFDDVILYNFFTDSDVTHQKWRLLDSLTIQEIQLDEFEYNQNFFTFEEGKKNKKAKAKEEKPKEATEIKEKKEKKEKKEGEEEEESDDDDIEDEKLGQDSVQLFNASLDITTSKYLIKKVGANINRKTFDMNPYSSLCTELKQLYVAITRPKNRLIIYDENIQNRKYVEEYWRKLDLVQVVSKKDLENESTEVNPEIASFKALVIKTNANEWRKQGVRMFKNKYYEQALKCFEKSGDFELGLRAKAYHLAEVTSSRSSEIGSKMMYIKEKIYPYNTHTPAMRKSAIKELKQKEKELRKDFFAAGETFEKIGLLKQAAQCYFSAEKFQKALKTYEQIGYWKQAAEAAFQMKDYSIAAEYYDKGGDYIRTIECLAEIKQYEKVLEIIHKYGKVMPVEQRENFAKRYVPLALKSLLTQVDYNIEDLEEKKKEEQEAKLKGKNNVGSGKVDSYPARIEEEDEDEEDESEEESDEEEEEEEEEKKEEENKEKETEGENKEGEEVKEIVQEKEEKTETKHDVSDMSFSEIQAEKSKTIKFANKKDASEMSFEVVESKDASVISIDENTLKPRDFGTKPKSSVDDMSFDNISSANIKATTHEKLEDFEHLSHIDPEDEWLRMETGSIVEKLSAIRRQDSASLSEYSAIDFNHVMNNQCTLVKTKNDIFAQDNIMQKIIKFISMFSEDVKQSLNKLRSKKTLLSHNEPSNFEQDSIIDVMVDLDEISTEFIYLILDLLEHYKLYKLCIFVCNRYGLSQKLGRYLVNIASKYSNFAAESIAVNKMRLLNNVLRQIQYEKAFIANIAFHNVLENINPEFLRLKKKDEAVDFTNSLGNECFSELINLGFWKKCLFLMDYDSSLALASTFASFKNFKLICLKENDNYKVENMNALLANENFDFLPFKTPSTPEEIKYCFVALDAVIWDLTDKFPIYIHRDNMVPYTPDQKLELPPFASFFAFNGILWNYVYHRTHENAELFEKYLSDALTNLSKILKNADFKSPIIELRIYDLIVFFIQLTLLYPKISEIEDSLLNLSDARFEELISIFNNLLVMTNNIMKTSKYHETIIRALITPFRIRFIEKCKVLEHICNSYFVAHINSPLIGDLISFTAKNDQTDSPLTSSVMIDLDGNFIATPINVVLSCIRKKLVGTMKHLVSSRIKTIVGTTYDESAERVERYIHVIGLIECFRFAAFYTDENNAHGTNSMYSKQNGPKVEDPIYAQIKSELKSRMKQLEDIEAEESYEPEEREILVAGVQKEIKRIREFMKKKAIKLDNQPFEAQKTHYLKAIRRNCQMIKNTKIRMNPFVRQAILNHIFQKVVKGIQKGKISYNYVNMFHLLGEEIYLHEILRKYKNHSAAKTLQLYSDAIAYRKFYCVEDYANNLFDYISAVFSSLELGQKVYLLEDATPMIIIATALKNNKKSIKLSREIIRNMEDLTEGPNETTFVLKKNILPVEGNEILAELAHWVEKASLNMLNDIGNYGENEIHRIRSSLLRIILSIIASIEKLEYETVKKLKYALKNTIESVTHEKTSLEFLLKFSSVEDFINLSKDLCSAKTNIPYKFVTINIESNLKKAEEEYEKCDKAYLDEQVLISKRINLKKAVLKIYNKNSFAKMKAKINFDSYEHNYLLVAFKNLADHNFVLDNIFHLVKKNSALLQLFYDINNFLKKALFFFFKSKLENPLDFHYIMSLLHALAKNGADYAEFIRDLTINKQFTPEKNKIFVSKKVEITDLEKEFEKWANTREVQENLNQKLRKKRIIGVKWEERALKDALKRPGKKAGSKKKRKDY